jgi:putative hydrolase of the HAD superfamily
MAYADFFAIYNDIFTPVLPVIDVLARVKAAGYRTLLLSNTDPERFGFVRRRFPEILFFDDYVLSYELKLLKPEPAIYRAAAAKAGRLPEECVFIDDMEENVKGAVAAGLAGVLYRPETDLAAELRKLGLKF